MVIALGLQAPEGSETSGARKVDVNFDLQLLEVNEDQEIKAPQGAKSFQELVARLDELGLGNLGLGGAIGGGGAAGGGADPDTLEQYSECIRQAGGKSDEVRKCADLLTTP
jgi:hypothetical protein